MRRRLSPLLPCLLLLLGVANVDARLFRADNGDRRLLGIPLELQAGRSHCAPATMAAVICS